MSQVTATTFVIAVPDLTRSAAYYRDVLGFTIHELGDPGWRVYQKDCCRIMAGACPEATPPHQLGDHAYFAYLTITGIADYFAQVQANGAKIGKPLRDEPWGMREFSVQTADGHRIMFGEARTP